MNKTKTTQIPLLLLITLEARRELKALKQQIWQYLSKEREGETRQIKQALTYKISKYLVDKHFAKDRKLFLVIFIGATIALW